MAKATAEYATKVFEAIESTAGTESTAKMMSEASTTTSAARSGVA